RIFRLESERVVSQDGVARYANRYFQLPARNGAQTAARTSSDSSPTRTEGDRGLEGGLQHGMPT
ncbi:MAG: hypothetical protein ACRD4C_06030, partial [Candidatus Acidiferrales bacterium]